MEEPCCSGISAKEPCKLIPLILFRPVEEKEKSQDIFSLASTKDYLFYGCRNHQVYSLGLSNFEIMQPFNPPHFDVVTSLAIVDNVLVSGSRDKNIRCWDPTFT